MRTRLIGLAGRAGSGKSTVGDILAPYGFQSVGFATRLKAMLYILNPVVAGNGVFINLRTLVDEVGYEEAKRRYPEVRRLLQVLGTECVRDLIAEDAWIFALLRRLNPKGSYAVTDVRFPNEVEAIKGLGGEVWFIRRPGHNGDEHVSEQAVDAEHCDVVIDNDGTLEELRGKVLEAIAGVKPAFVE